MVHDCSHKEWRDQDIVHSIRGDDLDQRMIGWEALVEKYGRRMKHVVERWLDNPEDVNDVLQDTWHQIDESIHQLKDPGFMWLWIRRILERKAFRRLRYVKRLDKMTAYLGSDDNIELYDESVLKNVEAALQRRENASENPACLEQENVRVQESLIALLDKLLSKKDAELLREQMVFDIPLEQMASQRSMTKNAVKVACFRARHALWHELGKAHRRIEGAFEPLLTLKEAQVFTSKHARGRKPQKDSAVFQICGIGSQLELDSILESARLKLLKHSLGWDSTD